MKKRIVLSGCVLTLLALVLTVFAGCQRTADTTIIGLSLPTQREARWVSDKVTMEAEAARLGIDLRVQVADADMAQQAQQVETLLAQNIDVLILAPHDGAAAAALVAQCQEANVPVISYDRLIMNSADVDLYISFDNVGVGRLQGQWLTQQVPRGRYIIMSGAPTDNNATLFKQGAMEFIQPLIDSGAITVIAEQAVDNWLPANALAIVENALTANNNLVDAILSPNDGCAGGAIQALAAQGLTVPITGQDAEAAAAQRILAGTQGMTVFKDTRALGVAAIAAAIAFASGEQPTVNNAVNNNSINVPSNLLVPEVITRDNIDLLVTSGYLTREAVYGSN